MTTGPQKVRENRARRMAERQKLRLRKSPRRDPRAVDYDKWSLDNGRTAPKYIYTLDEIEKILKGEIE
jgi:hypothetical protein